MKKLIVAVVLFLVATHSYAIELIDRRPSEDESIGCGKYDFNNDGHVSIKDYNIWVRGKLHTSDDLKRLRECMCIAFTKYDNSLEWWNWTPTTQVTVNPDYYCPPEPKSTPAPSNTPSKAIKK